MRYWWVNQNQTYAHEIEGGYLWAPKVKANGDKNHFYDNMTEVSPGDVVFSFSDTLIKAVGIAMGTADSSPIPTEFGTGTVWTKEGWRVEVAFTELSHPIRPKDHIDVIAPLLPSKYSPLQQSGNGNQGVYLAELPAPLADKLTELLAGQVESVIEGSDDTLVAEAEDQIAEDAIINNPEIGDTEKLQLVKSRLGQGLFKSRVKMIESECRISGVKSGVHLRASHIKPWRDSTNSERLDGYNGLLLAPHVDHLFDRGFISFTDDGDLIMSAQLEPEVLAKWSIPLKSNVGQFDQRQQVYFYQL